MINYNNLQFDRTKRGYFDSYKALHILFLLLLFSVRTLISLKNHLCGKYYLLHSR